MHRHYYFILLRIHLVGAGYPLHTREGYVAFRQPAQPRTSSSTSPRLLRPFPQAIKSSPFSFHHNNGQVPFTHPLIASFTNHKNATHSRLQLRSPFPRPPHLPPSIPRLPPSTRPPIMAALTIHPFASRRTQRLIRSSVAIPTRESSGRSVQSPGLTDNKKDVTTTKGPGGCVCDSQLRYWDIVPGV